MLRRFSARRFFFIGIIFIGVTVLISTKLNVPWLPALKKSAALQEEHSVEDAPALPSAVLDESNFGESNEIDEKFVEKEKPWYLTDGTMLPVKTKGPVRLFPDQADGDRIIDQLMYIPEDYQGYDSPEKVILAYTGLGSWGAKSGPSVFQECPVSRCSLTADKSRAADADAIIFKDHFVSPGVPRPMNQIWILYFLECPYHTQSIKFADVINWTATYRRDSDVVAPYERWTYYDPEVRQKTQHIDYAANKTKKVAWFVSNCGARNNRLQYARELSKYISVDIYGNCGPLKCPRSDKKCYELLDKEYKFYLAFENSNCRDYITEKFFVNGLGHSVLPIVMGARPEDYQKSAPEGSYIHVDEFSSPEELAAYLHRLDNDNALYNSYFKWKGTGELINTHFWCRLCAMMHTPQLPRHYEDVNDWWRGPGICTSKAWRNAEFV
ncbi:glycoprotein 3-alpha-L-fucosyltransferase A-like isoform X2 [Cylas formicarius]|nr:glycoprotein 3-alpha-L-fucosyltransferase A-like isoform X2 [Cylas formicarius]XP_060517099.1 glycoprotein 3-alpha-L-fucosyltransferase A-like isoform X2 [Cylas formicarius]XP_060517100.1 glycoprotein 3-alpha-L-fucosyltransferase A-like isoform X2 [Cylas formicarius]XP_060517101.1 glycoprotein 3-alpha-L-fucosyltransferase A-like isoform X2 [Cylas formicarius]XP_060517102.1 glycoprotein 3-alpha-L-fucosyltransferase A-like isoform X2 [Cylas formicarius]